MKDKYLTIVLISFCIVFLTLMFGLASVSGPKIPPKDNIEIYE